MTLLVHYLLIDFDGKTSDLRDKHEIVYPSVSSIVKLHEQILFVNMQNQ